MKTIAYLTLTGLALVQGAQIRGKAGAMVHDPVPPRCTGEVKVNFSTKIPLLIIQTNTPLF